MTISFEIPIQELTAEAFAPFGTLLDTHGVADFDQETKSVHRFDFAADSPTILQIVSFKRQPMVVRKIEFHAHVTESRMHIGGAPTVIVVGRPGKKPPQPEELRAFAMQNQGVMFKRGTWHGTDAYPLGAEPGRFLFLSDRATQQEIFDNPTETPKRTVLHDFSAQGVLVALSQARNTRIAS